MDRQMQLIHFVVLHLRARSKNKPPAGRQTGYRLRRGIVIRNGNSKTKRRKPGMSKCAERAQCLDFLVL